MLRELRLAGLKAFEDFRVNFAEHTILVGPNSAGKSTLISALRAASVMLRLAKVRSPDLSQEDKNISRLAYNLSGDRAGLGEENLRHEFRDEEARLFVKFDRGASLTAVWPQSRRPQNYVDYDDEEDEYDAHLSTEPYFYLELEDRPHPRRPVDVRSAFPVIGVIPALSPVERTEVTLNEAYVRQNEEGRLTSRHFRNQLLILERQNRLQDFLDFARPWVTDITLQGVETRIVHGDGVYIDFFLLEAGSRTEREVCWAGDGIQVWLQLLFHLFRLRDARIIVLDEPDLYLHPDLQRRLVRLMDSIEGQTIMATHSSEILAEASSEDVFWVDKSKRRAVRSPKGDTLVSLSGAIGSQFNLRLAKALRSRVVLFVEGEDMKLISLLARTSGTLRLANEQNIAIVPLKGFSNWEHVEPFAWLVDNFLSRSVTTFVILDSDYRSHAAAAQVTDRLAQVGIQCHVWHRKELESYLLSAPAIARLSGVPLPTIEDLVSNTVQGLKSKVFARILNEAMQERVHAGAHRVTITEDVQVSVDSLWEDPQARLAMAPPKDVLRQMNTQLQARGARPLSTRALARALRVSEIDDEMRNIFQRVEDAIIS
jgi:energy-coupling factor transporter ATP-binding protein EcfA2